MKPSVPELSILFDSFLEDSLLDVPQPQDSMPNSKIHHQQQPQGFLTKQTFQPSVNMQPAQENLSEHGHNVGVDRHMMKSSHVSHRQDDQDLSDLLIPTWFRRVGRSDKAVITT